LARRQILSPAQLEAGKDPELAFYLCAGPPGTTDEELIRVACARWAIEECFQTAKNEVGLDQYQVRALRRLVPPHHLALLAHAYLSVTAAIAPKDLAAASSRSPSQRSAVTWHT
jgi:SRSO17 transposase